MPVSGMTVQEATLRARTWWQEWRGAIKRGFNAIEGEARIRAGGTAPGLVVRDPGGRAIQNGIMDGLSWESLTLTEQQRVRDYWHQNFIIAPQHGGRELDIARVGRGRLGGTSRPINRRQYDGS